MTHWAKRYRTPAFAAMIVWLGLAVGGCRKVAPGGIIAGNVVPEDENEQRLTRPGNLGGPGHGTPSPTLKVRPTPVLDDFIENLTDDQLVAYLSQLQYDMGPGQSHRVRAACVHNPSGLPHPIPAPKRCNLGDGAELAIEPEVGMHLWEFSDIPEHGMVVARIINYDKQDREEATYGFPPDRRVWWVVDRPNGVLRSRFFVRTYQASPAVRPIRDAAAVYPLVNCHPTEKHANAEARFAKCSEALHLKGRSSSRSAARPTAVPVASLLPPGSASSMPSVPLPQLVEMVIDGTWVTCKSGCCATSP